MEWIMNKIHRESIQFNCCNERMDDICFQLPIMACNWFDLTTNENENTQQQQQQSSASIFVDDAFQLPAIPNECTGTLHTISVAHQMQIEPYTCSVHS